MAADREQRLLSTIITLMGDATGSSDAHARMQLVVDEAAALFDADAAGLMLLDPSRRLQVTASVGHHSGLLELLQLEADEGPCVEAARTGDIVSVADITTDLDRWPAFSRAAEDAGYRSVHSIPLRLRSTVIGSLNLFRHAAGSLDPADMTAARALADIVTITLLQQRTFDDDAVTRAQLQGALDSRAVIEQAKGWIANRYTIDPEQAFALIRHHARSRHERVIDVARGVLAGNINVSSTITARRPGSHRP